MSFREVPPASPLATLKGATERAEGAARAACVAPNGERLCNCGRHGPAPISPPLPLFLRCCGSTRGVHNDGCTSSADRQAESVARRALCSPAELATLIHAGQQVVREQKPTPAAMLAEALEHLRRAEVLVREVWRSTGHAEGAHEAIAVAVSEAVCAHADATREAEALEPSHGR